MLNDVVKNLSDAEYTIQNHGPEYLNRLVDHLGCSQRGLARALGYSHVFVNAICNGAATGSSKFWRDVVKFCNDEGIIL